MVASIRPEGATRGGPLVIVGASAIAEVAYEYFTYDSPYDVVAFSVEEAFLDRDEIFGLPVAPFEQVAQRYDPGAHSMFVAIGYGQMNRVREDFVGRARHLGYPLASYVSSEAFVWPNVEIGEHCFLLEHNVIQSFVTIGDNVTLWSGNHIGHHSRIGDHCFIASHVVVSGFVDVGDHCFVGVNVTIANNLAIARDCLIGAGASILRDTRSGEIYAGDRTQPRDQLVYEKFGLPDPAR
jgi:sugar O-acyltransferase (sialic acid O-acetyltransferase NeuD family)